MVSVPLVPIYKLIDTGWDSPPLRKVRKAIASEETLTRGPFTVGLRWFRNEDGEVEVSSILRTGPAATAGIKQGERIVAVNGAKGREEIASKLERLENSDEKASAEMVVKSISGIRTVKIKAEGISEIFRELSNTGRRPASVVAAMVSR
jgi:predicted metalloprotease with PDZ domain